MPEGRGVEMELGAKQELFARLFGVFLQWFHAHPTWRMRFQEGFVGFTDGADGDYDGPHKKGGAHYNKIGIDVAVFLVDTDGRRIPLTTYHLVWDEIGTFWKSLHPLCRWGGDFAQKDYNHLSLIHEGIM